MKKKLLLSFLLAGLGSAQAAQAQAALVNLIGAGIRLGVQAARRPKTGATPVVAAPAVVPVQAAAPVAPAPLPLVLHRTPAEQLPKRGAPQITALETALDRCHTTLLADSAGVICPAAQRTALQQAIMQVAQASPGWDLQPYQREAAFYVAEDIRRQQLVALPK